MKRKLIQTCLLAAMLFALPAEVQAQFTYTTNNGAITITAYTGSGGDVTIPVTINGLPVTSIGDYAFANDDYPFSVSSLTNVTIGNSVTSIGEGAFSGTSLTSVIIPGSVTSIGDEAFSSCSRLTNITVAEGNSIYSSSNGVLFNKDQTTLVQHPSGNTATSYIIPDRVTNIGEYAFEDAALTSVAIPDSVTSIGDYAFYTSGSLYGVSSLTNVLIGNGVTNIGEGAFVGCYSLTSVTIGNGVNSIGDRTFADCGLTTVFSTGNAPSVGQHAFYSLRYNGNVNEWFIEPATVYYLSGTTGWGATCGDLPTVMLNAPPQFGATGDGFEYLSDGVKVIITGYSGSNSVLTIPATITGLPVTRIVDYAFAGSGLTNVTIPDSVTNIGDDAFGYCNDLTNVSIGNSVTSIGNDAFVYCVSLTSVTIPDSVTSIGDEAFEFCFSLNNVMIGNGITSIGDEAFYESVSLTKVHFKGNAPTADSYAFYGDPAAAYYLPGTLGWDDFCANTGLPIAQWFLPNPLILNRGPGFGVQSGQFGFTISWATNVPVVVEACTNLANPVWLPVTTNTLVGGASYFSDPQPANLPGRFYRLRSP